MHILTTLLQPPRRETRFSQQPGRNEYASSSWWSDAVTRGWWWLLLLLLAAWLALDTVAYLLRLTARQFRAAGEPAERNESGTHEGE